MAIRKRTNIDLPKQTTQKTNYWAKKTSP